MNLLIRDVPANVIDALRSRAKENGRSVQAVAREALERGIQPAGRSLIEWAKTVANPEVDVEAGLRMLRQMRRDR